MSIRSSLRAGLLLVAVVAPIRPAWSCEVTTTARVSTVQQIEAFFAAQRKTVLTFTGYSGAEYEDRAAMLARAAALLDARDPKATIVNIGATLEGIGAVYELAKGKGFQTTGIVSTQARESGNPLAPCVDTVFYVEDATWGGLVAGTTRLSPTSAAMVAVSDEMVAIGGGEVARDELQAAVRQGRKVQIFPADMNHQTAIDRALKKGQPAPTDFRGAVATAFRSGPGAPR